MIRPHPQVGYDPNYSLERQPVARLSRLPRHPRQMLAVLLEPLDVGQLFNRWPLHLTLVPWFVNHQPRRLDDRLGVLAAVTKPCTIRLGEMALFGPQNNWPGRLIQAEDRQACNQLHLAALEAVTEAGNFPDDLSHVSYKFRPHVTLQESRAAETPAESYLLDKLVLVTDLNWSDWQIDGRRQTGEMWRQVAAVYELEGRSNWAPRSGLSLGRRRD